MVLKVISGAPEVVVEIWSTENKSTITAKMGDTTSELVSVTTQKDLASPTGNFSIVLVPRKDGNEQTWFDKIRPLDFVSISFKGILDQKPVVTMRGLVDFVEKSESFAGGVPRRSITVTGRDLGCLLTDFSIYYLPELGKKEAARSLVKVMAWEVNPRLIVNAKEAFEFLSKHWMEMVDLTIQGQERGEANLKRISSFLNRSAESFYPGNFTGLFFLMSYSGTWQGAFQQFQDKPFHELFVYDDDKYSWLILRPARLKDSHGNYPQVVNDLMQKGYSWMYPENMVLNAEEKINVSVQKGGTEVYSYYFTVPTQELLSKEKLRMALINPDDPKKSINPYIATNSNFPSYIGRYGFRPLEVNTTFVFMDGGQISGQGEDTDLGWTFSGSRSGDVPPDSQGEPYLRKVIMPNFLERGEQMNKVLVTWFLHNPMLYHGLINMAGSNRALIGTYVWDNDDRMQYYIEGVTHTFSMFETFTTQLRVTRGMPFEGFTGNVNVFNFDGDLPESERVPATTEVDKAPSYQITDLYSGIGSQTTSSIKKKNPKDKPKNIQKSKSTGYSPM